MISIIVPVYNVEAYLAKCIDSIVRQTYQDLEIILVDDGSTDKSPRICDEWAEKDTRIRVIHKVNGGPSSARNAGLCVARGEYIGFVDADDYVELDLYERVMDFYAEFDVDIVTFDCYMVNEKGKILGNTENVKDGVLSCEQALTLLIKGDINNYVWNKVYKRHVFDGIKFPEGKVWEDVAIGYKLLLNCQYIYCSSNQMYYYLQRANSITRSINAKTLQDIFGVRHAIYVELKDKYPEAEKYAFYWAMTAARRLYDRSVYAVIDEDVLNQGRNFLAENRERILKEYKNLVYAVYFYAPETYRVAMLVKHICGNVVRYFRKQLRKWT